MRPEIQSQFSNGPHSEPYGLWPAIKRDCDMRVCEIIGKVTLSHWHPSLTGASWRVAVPLTLEGIEGKKAGRTEPIVIYDEVGGCNGMLVAVAEGPEATAPFLPVQKPIDAYNAAILDHIEVEDWAG